MPKKNNHTHKTIFTWIGNLPTITELQGFHYYQGKYKVRLHCFNLLKDDNNNKTLITKTGFFYILRTKFIMGYKTGQKMSTQAQADKPPLHGLSLSKSSIKNHATLFRSGHQSNQTQIRLHKAQHRITSSCYYFFRRSHRTFFFHIIHSLSIQTQVCFHYICHPLVSQVISLFNFYFYFYFFNSKNFHLS